MRRFDSPKIRINQTHYPDKSYSRERLPTPKAFREESLDHKKYKPIMRQSSSRFQTPPLKAANNLFESALKKNTPDQRYTEGPSKTPMTAPGMVILHPLSKTHNLRSLAVNPALESITDNLPLREPRAVRELVEKNALFEKRDKDIGNRIKANAPGNNFLSRPATLEAQPAKKPSPRLQSPSSSNLYKPFFPGGRSPK